MATEKQIRAMNNLVENGGNIGKAMLEAGYSPATAKTPQKLTESVGWAELVDEYLPDELLARVHMEGLTATRVAGDGEKKAEVPDYATRHRYLETALKIKDKFPVKKLDITSQGEGIIGITYVKPTDKQNTTSAESAGVADSS